MMKNKIIYIVVIIMGLLFSSSLLWITNNTRELKHSVKGYIFSGIKEMEYSIDAFLLECSDNAENHHPDTSHYKEISASTEMAIRIYTHIKKKNHGMSETEELVYNYRRLLNEIDQKGIDKETVKKLDNLKRDIELLINNEYKEYDCKQ